MKKINVFVLLWFCLFCAAISLAVYEANRRGTAEHQLEQIKAAEKAGVGKPVFLGDLPIQSYTKIWEVEAMGIGFVGGEDREIYAVHYNGQHIPETFSVVHGPDYDCHKLVVKSTSSPTVYTKADPLGM